MWGQFILLSGCCRLSDGILKLDMRGLWALRAEDQELWSIGLFLFRFEGVAVIVIGGFLGVSIFRFWYGGFVRREGWFFGGRVLAGVCLIFMILMFEAVYQASNTIYLFYAYMQINEQKLKKYDMN